MVPTLFQDIYTAIQNDSALLAIWDPTSTGTIPVRARFKMAGRDEDFPYIVYSGKFIQDSHESGDALGTAFITFNVYDYQTNASRSLLICRALKRLFNRKGMSHMPYYAATRLFLSSHMNIPTNRENVLRDELIFKTRYYDNSTAEVLYQDS